MASSSKDTASSSSAHGRLDQTYGTGSDPSLLALSKGQAIVLLVFIVVALFMVHLWSGRKEHIAGASAFFKTFRTMIVTLVACSSFLVVGPVLMMLNKYIMEDLHFHHPISICSLGLVSSSIVSHLMVACGLGQIREESRKVVAGGAWFTVAMPIGLLKALTMSAGNAVYLHLSFGFIQMLKAFTPLIVLTVMRFAGVKLPTRAAIWCVTGIVAGTMVEVRGELHATVIGLILMLSSELFEAISVVLCQKILQHHRFSVLEGMYITAPAGGFCLLVGVLLFEAPDIMKLGHQRIPLEHPFVFAAAAALGVAINFISFLVMQLTSALTMKILNTVRSVALVVVGILFYGEEHPMLQLCGYAIALTGFAGYNYFQLYPDSAHEVESRVDGALRCACLCCPRRCRLTGSSDKHDGTCASRERAVEKAATCEAGEVPGSKGQQ